MSKLDDILDTEDWVSDGDGDEMRVYGPVNKQAIKDLFLEIIKDSQQGVANDNKHTVYGFDLLSSQLRKKVEDL